MIAITINDMKMYNILHKESFKTIGEIAEVLNVSLTQMSKTINKNMRYGLIGKNKRSYWTDVYLKKKGELLYEVLQLK